MLILDNICKAYNGTPVLDRVNIRIKPGDMLCLAGKSGIGKSTLLSIAAGLEKADSGRVIQQYSSAGFAFQLPVLLPWKTTCENMAFVLSGKKRAGAEDSIACWLEKLGLSDAADKRPDQLSGGMKKRLGLGTALVTAPDFLFLDEPFTFLDQQWQQTIAEILLDLKQTKGTTVFMASHELDPVRRMGATIFPADFLLSEHGLCP